MRTRQPTQQQSAQTAAQITKASQIVVKCCKIVQNYSKAHLQTYHSAGVGFKSTSQHDQGHSDSAQEPGGCQLHQAAQDGARRSGGRDADRGEPAHPREASTGQTVSS